MRDCASVGDSARDVKRFEAVGSCVGLAGAGLCLENSLLLC